MIAVIVCVSVSPGRVVWASLMPSVQGTKIETKVEIEAESEIQTKRALPLPLVLVVGGDEHKSREDRVIAILRAYAGMDGMELEIERRAFLATPSSLFTESVHPRAQDAATATFLLDLSGSETLRIYLYPQGVETVFLREVSLAQGEAVAIESLANIVSVALLAVQEGQLASLIGRPKQELWEEVENEVEQEPILPLEEDEPILLTTELTIKTWPRLRLGAAYIGTTFSPQKKWQQGAALRVGTWVTPSLYLDLGYHFFPEIKVVNEWVVFWVERHPIELSGGYRWELSREWALHAGLQAELDPVVRVLAPASDADRTESSLRVMSTVGAHLRTSISVSESFRLELTVALDAVLTRANYTVYTPQQRVLLEPYPLRFSLRAGFNFDLIPH